MTHVSSPSASPATGVVNSTVHGIYMVCEMKNWSVWKSLRIFEKLRILCRKLDEKVAACSFNPTSASTYWMLSKYTILCLNHSYKRVFTLWKYKENKNNLTILFFLPGWWDYPLWQMSQRLLPDGHPEESGPSQDARNHRSRRVEVSRVRSKTNLRTTGSLLGRLAGNFHYFQHWWIFLT